MRGWREAEEETAKNKESHLRAPRRWGLEPQEVTLRPGDREFALLAYKLALEQ